MEIHVLNAGKESSCSFSSSSGSWTVTAGLLSGRVKDDIFFLGALIETESFRNISRDLESMEGAGI